MAKWTPPAGYEKTAKAPPKTPLRQAIDLAKRPKAHSLRKLDAARTDRLSASWTTTPGTIDQELAQAMHILVARTRHEATNNDYCKKFLTMLRQNVIGPTGVRLQCRFQNTRGKLDKVANKAFEAAWKEFTRKGVCDVSGRRSFWDLERLHIATVATDGESLIRFHDRWDGNQFRFAVEVIDPLRLDVMYNVEDTGRGTSVIMGVEVDQYRRPLAYHILEDKPVPIMGNYRYSGRRESVPADQIIHSYMAEYSVQTRGVSWMTAPLVRLGMLHGYEEAELVAARLGASTMGFFSENAEGQGFMGDSEEDDEEYLADAEPGTFRNLPKGVQLHNWDPSHPNQAYPQFVKSALRGIASGLGVSYNGLANDLEDVNYSSMRHGAGEERELFMSLQNWAIQEFHDRVYRRFLVNALLEGAIAVQGGAASVLNEEKFQRVTWQPRRWPAVDPFKEEQANNLTLENRTKSRSQIIRDRGQDPEEVWEEIAAENEQLAEMGIHVGETTPLVADTTEGPQNAD